MTPEFLDTPAVGLDPRRNAFRPDLAAKSLEGKVAAPRYAAGEPRHVIRACVPVRRQPEFGFPLETEVLFGETVIVFDEADGWVWVQLQRDGYVGYVPSEAVVKGVVPPTHRVQTLGTFLYTAPDIKTPPIMHLTMNTPLNVRRGDDRFVELAKGGFVYARHTTPIDRHARDYADMAERFMGTPYLWGGRTRIGIDCSGLVQTALNAAGIPAPRDTDMQQAELGTAVPVPSALEGLQRGDLIFWKGHVGIMVDSVMMVHANAYHMQVAVEPLPEAAARIAKSGSPIAAIKRLPGLCA